jgi:PTH1 family peptidyl-tRNA hydrolase
VPAMLAKPQTFMNRSGAAVSELCGIFEIALSDLLVIVDDFNLPFGKLRLRSKGSDGGHNGLASIIDELGTSDFARLRVGIGKEFIDDTVDFVLSPFDKLERVDLKVILDQCVQACTSFVVEGINKAMNRYN